MMIKHQTELVDVINKQCPKHGTDVDRILTEDDLTSYSATNYFDEETKIICLCETENLEQECLSY